MNLNLIKGNKFARALAPVAAGTSNQNGAIFDTLGFESVVALLDVGTLTAGQVTALKWQGGNDAALADATDLAGTKTSFADGDSNTTLISELVKPNGFRYVRAVVLRGTQNAVINGMWYIGSSGHKQPVTHDTAVSHATLIVSPAAGTP